MLSSLLHEVGVYRVHGLHVAMLERSHCVLGFPENSYDSAVLIPVVALLPVGGTVLQCLHFVTDFRLCLAQADDTFKVACCTEVNLAEVAVNVATDCPVRTVGYPFHVCFFFHVCILCLG